MEMTLSSLLRAYLKNTTRRKPKRARVLTEPTRRSCAYRKQLLSLVKHMHQFVKEEILPVLKEPDTHFTPDALSESLVQRIQAALGRVSKTFQALVTRARTWAQRMVEQVDENNRTALIGSIRHVFRLDLTPLLNTPTLNAPLQLAMATNVHLVQ